MLAHVPELNGIVPVNPRSRATDAVVLEDIDDSIDIFTHLLKSRFKINGMLTGKCMYRFFKHFHCIGLTGGVGVGVAVGTLSADFNRSQSCAVTRF